MNLITHLITTSVLLNAAGASEDASQAAVISRMQTQMRALEVELLECRLEMQSWKVAWLERDLQAALFDKQRLEAAGQAQTLEIRQVDQQLSTNDLASDERSELQSARGEIAGARMATTRAEFEIAERRYVTIGSQLQAEQQKLQTLWLRMTALLKTQASPQ